ncbi:MAG: hypothetical protein C0596_07685 [Marinilabiliales bacterium]|nr:MAG: hypothetical protein C0596_07685 [Marinilabiliales bacterium]
MKRFFTFLIFAIFTISTVFAKSFEVYDHEDNLINGETITVPTTIGGPELYYYFTVKNTSGSQKTVKIGIELQTTQIDGSYHSICSPTTNNSTGQCGMPWGSTSAQFILDPSETSGDGDFRFTQGPN